MLRTRVIPVLLLKDAGLVKTVKFRNPKYVGDPINAVKIFNDKEVDELMSHYAHEIVGEFWDPKIKLAWNNYRDINFPFEEINPPEFEVSMNWNLEQYVQYLMSWSSTNSYIKKNDSNPVELIVEDLEKAWGDPNEIKRVTWDIFMRIGRK